MHIYFVTVLEFMNVGMLLLEASALGCTGCNQDCFYNGKLQYKRIRFHIQAELKHNLFSCGWRLVDGPGFCWSLAGNYSYI